MINVSREEKTELLKDKKLKVSSYRLPVLYISEKSLVEYLNFYGKGADSLDYEIAVCVWVKRLFESNGKRNYCFAFELEQPLDRIMPNFDSGNPLHIKQVLDSRKSNTPADFYLVKGSVKNREDKGIGFQLKQFGKGVKSNFIDRLIEYLNKILSKYRPGEVGLIVVLDVDTNLDHLERSTLEKKGILIRLFDKVKVPPKSFKKIFLMGKNVDNEVYFQEVVTGLLSITLRM